MPRPAHTAVLLLLTATTTATAAEPDAPKIFAKSCALCHGPEGQPTEAFAKLGVRSFKDKEWQKATSDAQLDKSIREGKKGTLMASFDKQLSADEIKALVAHIRKLGGAQPK